MASTSSSDFFTITLGARPAKAYRIPPPPVPEAQSCPIQRPHDPAEGIVAARWLKKGQTLSVGKFLIPGGLIYTTLCVDPRAGLYEPSLLNTLLKLSSDEVDPSASLMTYWPE